MHFVEISISFHCFFKKTTIINSKLIFIKIKSAKNDIFKPHDNYYLDPQNCFHVIKLCKILIKCFFDLHCHKHKKTFSWFDIP